MDSPMQSIVSRILSRGAAVLAVVGASAAFGQQTPIPLVYNFNGIAHTGEQGLPDDLNGFRSISDRGLLVQGAAGQFGTSAIVGNTGLPYTINLTAFTLDLVHLGNRSQHWAYEAEVPGPNANIGVQPTWDVTPDHTGPQTTDASSLGLVLQPNSEIGVLHHASSGGGGFDVTLNFTDATSVTVRAAGPDWFGGSNAIPARAAGVSSQARIGGANATWPAVQSNDLAATATPGTPPAGPNLSVFESVISVPQLILDGKGSHVGKTLASITFGNADIPQPNSNRGFAIFAASHQGSAVANPSGIGGATPAQIAQGGTTKLRVGAVPASGSMNAITSVVVDASALGLSATLALNDSGTNGDLVAGDSLWSSDIVAPIAAPAGPAALPFTVTDEQARTGGGSIALTIVALPTVSVDLGTLPTGLTANNTLSLVAGQVHWFKFTLTSPVDRALGQYLDIDTEGSLLTNTSNDTEIGLFDSNGNLITADDDDGSGNLSQLSYGLAAPARPAFSGSLTYNGRDAAVLPAGTYYLAVVGFNSTFASPFNVVSPSTRTGTLSVRFNLNSFTGGGVPTTFTDLGNFGNTTATNTQAVAGNVVWYRLTLDTDVARNFRNYLDLDTEGSTIANTSMCLFNGTTGAIVTQDTDDGTDLLSQLSYGWALSTRPAPGNGVAYNGRDGATVAAGTYYLAVGEAPVIFAANFVAAFPGGTAANINVNVRRGVQPPRDPVVVTGPIVNPANGHSYTLWRTSATTNNWFWEEAEAACVLAGGHLVEIADADENAWVLANVLNFDGITTRRSWLGYTDQASEGFFTWTNGSSSVYTNFGAGEPNNAGGTEHYVEMIGNGTWNDLVIAGSNDYAILETEPSGGACCNGTTCSVTSAGACTGANTRFVGNGSTCNAPGNTTTPCCRADYNQSGGVTVQDIFDFLAGYFSSNAAADINDSGAVTVQDIFDFLAAYFAGCV